MDVVLMAFTGDNSSLCKKILMYQKNFDVTESDDNTDLLADKQTFAERVAVAEKIKSVTGVNLQYHKGRVPGINGRQRGLLNSY